MRPQNRFLLTTLAGAAATANALRPVKRTGPLSIPAFSSGLPTSELPLQTLALQVALALVAGRGGGKKGLKGAAGIALTAASAAGLNRLHQEALRADDVLEQALQEELGSDYRHRIREPFTPAPVEPLTRKSILLPDFGVRRRYRVEKDIAYGDAGRRNLLDIWRRSDLARDARAPVLVQIHGGAWMMGKKEGQGEPLMAHLVQRGWVCVAPNYRLSPRSTWPDHIVDVKKVLAWVKANIGAHGGDPEFVIITGGSAGGHLCSLAALTPGLPEFQPGFEDADTRVNGCVAFYGVYDFTNRHGTGREDMQPFLEKRVFKSLVADDRPRWEQASTISHVGPDAPPFFVLHGTNDSLVPVEQARTFVDELRKTSRNPVVYAELPLAQHAYEAFPSVRAHATAHAVERFLAVVRSTAAHPPSAAEPAGISA